MSELALKVPCPYCGAKRGEFCQVPSTGRVLAHRTEGHSSRRTEYWRRKNEAATKKILRKGR